MRCPLNFLKGLLITGLWDKVNTAGSQSSIYAVLSQLEEGLSCNDITAIISDKPDTAELIRGTRQQNTFALSIINQPGDGQGSWITCSLKAIRKPVHPAYSMAWYMMELVNRIHLKTEMVLILDISVVKQYIDKWLKQPLKTPSNQYHIAYIKFTEAIIIINENVNLHCGKWNSWNMKTTGPLDYMVSYQQCMFNRNWLHTCLVNKRQYAGGMGLWL